MKEQPAMTPVLNKTATFMNIPHAPSGYFNANRTRFIAHSHCVYFLTIFMIETSHCLLATDKVSE